MTLSVRCLAVISSYRNGKKATLVFVKWKCIQVSAAVLSGSAFKLVPQS